MVASDVETSVAANGVRENVLACTGGAFDNFVTKLSSESSSTSISGEKRKKRQVNFEENCQFYIDKGHTYRGTTDTTNSGRWDNDFYLFIMMAVVKEYLNLFD